MLGKLHLSCKVFLGNFCYLGKATARRSGALFRTKKVHKKSTRILDINTLICYNIQKEKSLGVLVYRSMSVDGRQEIVKYDYGRMDVNLRDYGKNIFLGNDLTDEDIVSCIRAYRIQQIEDERKRNMTLCQKLKMRWQKLVA